MRLRNDAVRQGASLTRAARERLHVDGGHEGLREVGVLDADREQHDHGLDDDLRVLDRGLVLVRPPRDDQLVLVLLLLLLGLEGAVTVLLGDDRRQKEAAVRRAPLPEAASFLLGSESGDLTVLSFLLFFSGAPAFVHPPSRCSWCR